MIAVRHTSVIGLALLLAAATAAADTVVTANEVINCLVVWSDTNFTRLKLPNGSVRMLYTRDIRELRLSDPNRVIDPPPRPPPVTPSPDSARLVPPPSVAANDLTGYAPVLNTPSSPKASTTRPRLSGEFGFGVLSVFGQATPPPVTAGTRISVAVEAGIEIVVGRFRPAIFSRFGGGEVRQVIFSTYFNPDYKRVVGTAELALGFGLTFQPDPCKGLFVRGDIYPFFPSLADPERDEKWLQVEARPERCVGIGCRGSVGILLRRFVLSLTGEFSDWASRTQVDLYQPGWILGEWNERRHLSGLEVDFSTRVFRFGVCVGYRTH